MIVAIHQPNFLPWLGYFVKIARADTFVFLDNVQFTKSGFSKRVRIKNQQGHEVWLTVPIRSGATARAINRIGIEESTRWRPDMINKLRGYYGQAPFAAEMIDRIKPWLADAPTTSLAALNQTLILNVMDILGLEVDIRVASEFDLPPLAKDDLNIAIVKRCGGDAYLSGTGGLNYMDAALYAREGLEVRLNQVALPPYPQINGPFIPNLSVIDALFNLGTEGTRHLILDAAR